MSKDISFSHTTIDLTPQIVTKHKYGVRRPDGTIDWDCMNSEYQDAATDAVKLQHFHDKLRKKAVEAGIDPELYIDEHRFVRRTAIISITAPEEV